jgi:hypothetical protein
MLHPMGRRRYARKLSFPMLVAGVGLLAFGGTLYATTPDAPGRSAMVAYVEVRSTDQHYRDCAHAKAEGRTNIRSWDPSYRERMDKDGDGVACEPYF